MKNSVLLILALFTGITVFAQDIMLKGVVKHKGNKISGVSVLVEGSSRGTSTNENGEFSIRVSKNETLVFNLIGYNKKSVLLTGQSFLEVELEEVSIDLEETVVVGYSRQKKATLTGAVSAISGTELKERNVASLSNALQGKMPGVTIQQTSGQPGADGGSIRIRGIGSINSSSSPLVLVDGIEMDINQVDMNAVESISVLKDAASASIYGSRASNGVILITTKKGTAGKITTSYSGYAMMQRPTSMPDVVSAYEYLQAELDAWDNAGISVSPSQREQQLQLIEDQKKYKPDNWNRYDTDWKAETVEDFSLMHNHNLSIAGGSDKLTFFGSGSYLKQDGLIPNNNFDRLNVQLNADAKVLPWMTLGLNTIVRESKTLEPGASTPKSIINKSLYMLPTLSAARELDGYWGYGKNGDNPTALAYASGTKNARTNERVLNGSVTINPIEGLEFIGQYSNRRVEGRNTNLILPYKTSLRGNLLGIYPAQDNLTESWSQTIRNYYRTQASYEKSVGNHFAKFLVGFQAEDHNSTSFFGSKQGFDLERYYLDNGDGATATSGGGASSWAMQSGYARVNYTFNDKYLVEASGRYDGSSRFTPENRWGFFPSISAGWVISKESFMDKTSGVINFLKLRASYGLLGNQEIGNYPYTATINTGYGYYLGDGKELVPGVAQTTLSNSNISWEKSEQYNVGLDLNVLSNKLSLTADYYVKNIYDMLLTFALPYYAGMQPAYTNAGDMENKGWEIALAYKNQINDFKYNVTVSVSDNRNKITNLNGLNSQDKSMMEGYPNNGIWGYLSDGYYQDWDDVNNSPKLSNAARPGYIKYKKIYEGEGVDPKLIDSRDQVYLGDPFPHYEYGVNINLAYKNFDLTTFIQGVGERSTFMSGVGLKPFANGSNLFRHQLDYWTPENPSAAYPILVPEANSADNFVRSDKWVKDGSYMRLKNVVLGYNFPNSILKKANFSNLRVYISGQNLFTKSNFYKGYDPEVSYSGSVGGEFYPVMQTYTLGVDFKF
jgi:TonB-linked SusC/RagA family outer membrane protein